MTATAMLMREIETLPQEYVPEAISFVSFLKSRPVEVPKQKRISIKEARGIFRELQGMDTAIEREEEDRL
jgi:hypothetical protein